MKRLEVEQKILITILWVCILLA